MRRSRKQRPPIIRLEPTPAARPVTLTGMNGLADDAPSLEKLVESGILTLESLHPGGLTITADLADCCGVTTDTRVLDVACGTGETACFLAERYGARVTGLDRSRQLLTRARGKAADRGLEIDFREGDATALPFTDEAFDVVITECTLCLLDKAGTLAEMVRVVRRGGCVGMHDLYWQEDAPQALKHRLAQTEGETPETLDGWQQLFRQAGLVDITTVDRSPDKQRWMRDARRQLGMGGQIRVFLHALQRWGAGGLWRILDSERVFSDPRLGYAIVTGRRP